MRNRGRSEIVAGHTKTGVKVFVAGHTNTAVKVFEIVAKHTDTVRVLQ